MRWGWLVEDARIAENCRWPSMAGFQDTLAHTCSRSFGNKEFSWQWLLVILYSRDRLWKMGCNRLYLVRVLIDVTHTCSNFLTILWGVLARAFLLEVVWIAALRVIMQGYYTWWLLETTELELTVDMGGLYSARVLVLLAILEFLKAVDWTTRNLRE